MKLEEWRNALSYQEAARVACRKEKISIDVVIGIMHIYESQLNTHAAWWGFASALFRYEAMYNQALCRYPNNDEGFILRLTIEPPGEFVGSIDLITEFASGVRLSTACVNMVSQSYPLDETLRVLYQLVSYAAQTLLHRYSLSQTM